MSVQVRREQLVAGRGVRADGEVVAAAAGRGQECPAAPPRPPVAQWAQRPSASDEPVAHRGFTPSSGGAS